MSPTPGAATEADVLEQVVSSERPGFSPEVTRAILTLRLGPAAVSRMNGARSRVEGDSVQLRTSYGSMKLILPP